MISEIKLILPVGEFDNLKLNNKWIDAMIEEFEKQMEDI